MDFHQIHKKGMEKDNKYEWIESRHKKLLVDKEKSAADTSLLKAENT